MSPTNLRPRPLPGEVPLDQVRQVRRIIAIGGDPERARLAGDQTLAAHDLPHQLGGTPGALVGEIGVDPPIPVGTVRGCEEVPNLGCQRVPSARGGRLRALQPVVEP